MYGRLVVSQAFVYCYCPNTVPVCPVFAPGSWLAMPTALLVLDVQLAGSYEDGTHSNPLSHVQDMQLQ